MFKEICELKHLSNKN